MIDTHTERKKSKIDRKGKRTEEERGQERGQDRREDRRGTGEEEPSPLVLIQSSSEPGGLL